MTDDIINVERHEQELRNLRKRTQLLKLRSYQYKSKGEIKWQQVIGEKCWSSLQESLRREPNISSITSQKKGQPGLQERNARDAEGSEQW